MASSSKPSKKAFTTQLHQSSNKIHKASNKNPNSSQEQKTGEPFNPVSPEETSLSMSSHLTRQELLRRRLHHVTQLTKVYKDNYWALMEELRLQHRAYYWKYGVSPYKEKEEREEREVEKIQVADDHAEGSGETTINNMNTIASNGVAGGKLGIGFGEVGVESKVAGNNRCAFVGCKLKAMALTSFCHLHILSDQQQQLYKACNYVIKSAQAGPIMCGKPILRSTVPALCNIHFQKAQKHVTHALKKAGLNVSSSSKLAPKFHVIVAEYVRQIQSKRRDAQRHASKNAVVVKEEAAS